MFYNHAKFRMHISYVTKENCDVKHWSVNLKMARLTRDEELASFLDSDDNSDDFGYLDSEREEEEYEEVSAYIGKQQFGLEKLAALSQVISTEL